MIVIGVDLDVLAEARRDEAEVRDLDIVGTRHDVEVNVLGFTVFVVFKEPARYEHKKRDSVREDRRLWLGWLINVLMAEVTNVVLC